MKARAQSLLEAQVYDEAAETWEIVVERAPSDGHAWYQLGVARYRIEEFEEAAQAFRRAADQSHRVATSLYNAASSFCRAGVAQEAEIDLERALAAGFSNKYVLLIDPDLDCLRDDTAWQVRISEFFGTGDYPELSQPVRRIQNMGIQQVPMQDGVQLATEIVLPQNPGPHPTVLVRTPYGKGWQVFHRSHWAARGYALVVQDVRGRGDSEGEFEPWLNERLDGHDALQWVREQPWSNGRVGMIGASYVAQVQWLAAAETPDGPDAMIPLVSGTDPFLDTPYDHGILKMALLEWSYTMTYPGTTATKSEVDALRTLPLSDVDRAYLGSEVPIWDDWVIRSSPSHWRRASFLADVPRIRTAVLHVSGLWDVESIGTAYNWRAMKDAGLENRWLVFGPWPHQNFVDPLETRRGDTDYGDAARMEFLPLWVRFFDHWLKGADVEWEDQPRARVFITGADKWTHMNDFPPPEIGTTELYGAGPQETDGYCALTVIPPPGDQTMTYRYDPANVPTQADPTFARSTIYQIDPDTEDELRFATLPLEVSVTTVGTPELDLHFSTDVPDTDFFALLLDIDPAGTARAVGHPGKVRALFRSGWNEARPLEVDRVERARIIMFPVAHRFREGHRIGLVIRSDWFPRFARNLNTGENPVSATRTRVAETRIHVGSVRSTVLRLPTWEGGRDE